MKTMIGVMVVLVMIGCTTSATFIHGPDGSPNWVRITCHRSPLKCYRRAAEECPYGYEVKKFGGQQSSYKEENGLRTSTVVEYSGELLIKCNVPEQGKDKYNG